MSNEFVMIIPVLNEQVYIGGLLKAFLADGGGFPIWVYDGGSTDETRDIVARLAKKSPRIFLFDNPGKNQASAVNLAASRALAFGFEFIIRTDAHAQYPAKYAENLIATLICEKADSVVVPIQTLGGNLWQNAARELHASWLGNGGAAHRTGDVRGWVEHGHHAAFRLQKFIALGGYDTRFAANEDVEFDTRLLAAGGRIFLENQVPVAYFPRTSPGQFWQQMYRNGKFRICTALKHQTRLNLRQKLPVLATFICGFSLIGGLITHPLALVPIALYLAMVLVLSVRASRVFSVFQIIRIAFLAVLSHIAFGCGAIVCLHQTAFHRRNPRRIFRPAL